MSKSYEVRILNPAAGRGYTSLKCAKRYVGEKRADWVAPDGAGGWDVVNERPNMPRLVLRFREQDERVQAVLRCAEKRQLDRVYDTAAGSGMATLEQIENLPVTRPMDLRLVRKTRGLIRARAVCQVSDRAQVRGSGRCGTRRIFSW